MFYLDSNYSDYTNLVEVNDNYLVLSNFSRISGSSGDLDYVPVVYQYLQPSGLCVPGRYYSYDSFTFTDVSSLVSDSIYDRSDFPLIFICGFIIFLIFAFVINQLTRLVKKGGILFGSN